ncbi:MAG: hypothetical protein QOF59_334, partial [Actinomycetota bacterium]|nr:hypothetical protein [Actinomycetota bacterium]
MRAGPLHHNETLVADSDDPRIALAPGSNRWPEGTTVALGTIGALGMVLITLSGIVVGPTGPTGSSVERGFVALVPKGTARTVVGASTMTLGLVLVLGAWLVLGLLLRR